MRLLSFSRPLLALTLVIGLCAASGCGPSDPPLPPEPEYCTAPTTRDLDAGTFDGTPPRTITVGGGDGASFVAWSDGAVAMVIMGFQGGAMITPTIRVTARPADGATMCLHVALHNTLSDASEVFPGAEADLTFVRVGDVFEAANFYDQLGYDAALFRGKTLMLVVDVTGTTFTATSTTSLQLN